MLDLLPAELAIRVIEHAALDFRFSVAYRQSVVHLASASRTVYDIVAPILYHTLIVNRACGSRLQSFMFNHDTRTAALRMCSFVRVLVHNIGIPRGIEVTLFTGLECIYALGECIQDMLESVEPSQHNSLHYINVLSIDFADDVSKLPAHSRARITHTCGFLPLFFSSPSYLAEWSRMQTTPAAWALEILDSLPELTHLGLVLVNVRLPHEEDNTVEAFNMDSLRAVVQTALGYQNEKLHRVALRVGGRYIKQRQGEIEEMVRQVGSSRFSLWWDERSMKSWHQWNECTNADVAAGRDIWTMAQAMS